jgi:anaerobic magnesium-protoporphyrin IX monomethyl ester cyclase
MRLAFVNPPFLSNHGRYSREQRSPAITKSGTFYYPMWLSYAAGFMEAQGHDIRVWDAPAKRLTSHEVITQIEGFRPEVLVIATSTPSIYEDVAFCAAMKLLLPDSHIVLVGAHVTALPVETLNLDGSIDAVIIGEYEVTLSELTERIAAGRDMNEVAGLAFRQRRDKAIVVNDPRGPLRDLDSVPWVARTYRRHLDYGDYFYSGNRFPIVVIVSSRGCPNRCTFCSYPQTVTGRVWRHRSVGDVIDEMEFAVREFSPLGEIMFEDDTFTASRERTLQFSEEMLRRGLKVRWSCNARPDLDLPTMKLMRRAGCRSLLVGFESGSQELLDTMNKGTNLNRFKHFMRDSKKAGLLVNGAFLVGMPGETKVTMDKTLEMAKVLSPDVAQFFPIMAYPGTRLYDLCLEKGYLSSKSFRNYLTENGLHNCIVNLPNLSAEEMVAFCDRCRREFYLRPSYLGYKLLQLVSDPAEGSRTLKALRTFAGHLWFGTSTR